MIDETLFGQNKSDVTNIFVEELRQKIGGEKFDSSCYWQNYGKI